MDAKIVVSILSGNRLLRESIARILSQKREFSVLAVEPSIDRAVTQEMRADPNVWVSDSLRCLTDSAGRYPAGAERPGGVLVAMQDDAKTFLAAVRRGVRGYVLQEASAVDVIAAVRGVAHGEAVCPPRLMRVLFDYVSSRNGGRTSRARSQFGLTRREQELVPLVGRGLTNKEIAAELCVSEQTIKSHIHRILRKVGVEDRTAIEEACEEDRIEL